MRVRRAGHVLDGDAYRVGLLKCVESGERLVQRSTGVGALDDRRRAVWLTCAAGRRQDPSSLERCSGQTSQTAL
jgi:hypothetical protein